MVFSHETGIELIWGAMPTSVTGWRLLDMEESHLVRSLTKSCPALYRRKAFPCHYRISPDTITFFISSKSYLAMS